MSVPRPFATCKLGYMDTFKQYQAQVQENFVSSGALDRNGNIEDEWSFIEKSVTSAASDSLGFGRHRKPDWFVDSQSVLESLICEKNICHQRLLSENTVGNRQTFLKIQRSVSKAVRQAKDKWVMSVAEEAEGASSLEVYLQTTGGP